MQQLNIEQLVSEICIHLHNANTTPQTTTIFDMVRQLESDANTVTLIAECIELRANDISFKIRDTQMRLDECANMISSIRFSPQGIKYEAACLDSLYTQSKQFSDKLCMLRKLDLLLLNVVSILNDTKYL